MSYLSEFYQSAKNVARRAICDPSTQSAIEQKKADISADITLRLGALGFGTASAGIGLIAMQVDAPVLVTASFALAASSILSLVMLKRKAAPHYTFLANGAVWLAASGFVASTHPAAAAIMLAALGASFYKADLLPKQAQASSDTVAHQEMQNTITAETPSEHSINTKGEAIHDFCIGSFHIKAGEHLAERLHLTDRVSFLRALSDLRSDTNEQVEISVRANVSAANSVPRYETMALVLQRDGANIAVSAANEIAQQETEIAEQEVVFEPEDTNAKEQNNNRFLTIVSHELRTPLNAIIGFSDVLRSDIGRSLPQETQEEYVNLIHGAGTHLLSLVNTILDVSKLDSGAYEIHRDEFEFGVTARDCIAMLSGQAKIKNVQINDRIVGELKHVNGDRRAIKQILINLLSNAIKYTHDGGFVTVDADHDKSGFWFEVSDTGIGMEAHELEKIGKPFAQLDNSTTRNCEGTGLGLVLVKGLVELHGGTMTITSKQDVGTRISIHIPDQDTADSNAEQNAALSQLKDMLPHVKLNSLQVNNKEISHDARKVG
ncbi:HAMP domain-containing sensor histidine kinase [Ahrensia sp. 13_GOM-1096m]|uniref:sensor histidine kinase n=1 Tax=Ahrensia sp. 13_GOM-1096m TaxID=1380380 RepID=UPI000684FF55|nr:HAMP domain-containing sensor histidine kinase [Ahrensia sp. 13_GOM-1096m]